MGRPAPRAQQGVLMRAWRFARVLEWDPHPLHPRERRRWKHLRKIRNSQIVVEPGEIAQDLRKVAALLNVGLSAKQAWRELEDTREDKDKWGIPVSFLSRAGEYGPSIRASCGMSAVLGAPLAEVLEVCADGFDDLHQAREARRIAGAGPALSARILNALPVFALLAVYLMGINPFPVLFDGGVGTVSGLFGVVFLSAGYGVSRSMIRRSQRQWDEGMEADLAIVCDLIAAALDAGASIPRALGCLGECAGHPELMLVSKRLTLGLDWDLVWDECPQKYQPIADVLREAWLRGAAVDQQLRSYGEMARKKRLADARAGAEELGVRLVVPVGLLMLPAFMCLGVVPVLVTLARSAI